MKSRHLFLAAALIVTCAAAQSAHAQASRTWVSGVGDDANPCSRTAPCKTFAGAISKTAKHGEISVLDPGGFGALTINKSITINGGGIRGSILNAGTTGILVNITDASDAGVVTIHAIDFQGAGTGTNGIRFISGKQLNVRDCTITGNNASSGNGIVFAPAAAATLFVTNTTITDNAGHGLLVAPTGGAIATAVLDKVTATGNGGAGIRGEDGARVAAHECSSSSNNAGFAAVGGTVGSDMSVDQSVASGGRGYGIAAVGATATVRISEDVVTGNNTGIGALSGGSVISYSPTNRISGNTPGGDGDPTATVASK